MIWKININPETQLEEEYRKLVNIYICDFIEEIIMERL